MMFLTTSSFLPHFCVLFLLFSEKHYFVVTFIFTTWPMERVDNLGFKRAHPLQLLCRSLLKGLFLFSLGMLEKKYIYIYSYMPVQNKVSEHIISIIININLFWHSCGIVLQCTMHPPACYT